MSAPTPIPATRANNETGLADWLAETVKEGDK